MASQVHVTERTASHWSTGLVGLLKDLRQRRLSGASGSTCGRSAPPDVRKLDSSSVFPRRLPGDRDLDVGLPACTTGDFAAGTFDL